MRRINSFISNLYVAVIAAMVFVSCDVLGDEQQEPHVCTDEDIAAQEYLGTCPDELDIDYFHSWKSNGSFYCSGIRNGHWWFSQYTVSDKSLETEYYSDVKFTSMLEYADSDQNVKKSNVVDLKLHRVLNKYGDTHQWAALFKVELKNGETVYLPALGEDQTSVTLVPRVIKTKLFKWCFHYVIIDNIIYDLTGRIGLVLDTEFELPAEDSSLEAFQIAYRPETGVLVDCVGFKINLQTQTVSRVDYLNKFVSWTYDYTPLIRTDLELESVQIGGAALNVGVKFTYKNESGRTVRENYYLDLDTGELLED